MWWCTPKVKGMTASNGNYALSITALSFIHCGDKDTRLVNKTFREATAHSQTSAAPVSTPSLIRSQLNAQKANPKSRDLLYIYFGIVLECVL